MHWFVQLLWDPSSQATSVLILALAVSLGLALGSLKYRGIRLGAAGVLFSGLAFGHFGLLIDPKVNAFVSNFGLVLFVYSVGLAVGPGFFNALKAQGLQLNLLAAAVVFLGVAVTLVVHLVLGVNLPAAVGLFCGATTNVPSLGSATQVLAEHPPSPDQARAALGQVDPEAAAALPEGDDEDGRRQAVLATVRLTEMGCAVTYPFGMVGVILAVVALRRLFRVDPVREAEAVQQHLQQSRPRLERANLRITNPNLAGLRLKKIPALDSLGVVISRVLREKEILLARPSLKLQVGDILLAVGTPDQLDQLRTIVGERADVDLSQLPSDIIARWIHVTHKGVVGKTMEEMSFPERHGVQVTRLRRAGIELPPLARVQLRMGDQLLAVGVRSSVAAVAGQVGDAPRKLDEPDLIPIFVGLALGVVLGSWPIHLPGMPTAVKLGLAGGPLVVAMVLGQFPRVGGLVWYLPRSAGHLLRDVGITLFLAGVGLQGGQGFVAALWEGPGLWWMLLGASITLVPVLVVGLAARWVLGVDFLDLTGVLAGSMTNPPALTFANSLSGSEVSSIAYATVYPLAMILRVLCAQLMTLVWTG